MEIYDLFAIPEDLLPEVGGKARGLYLLHKAGLDVAPGFILYGIQNEADIARAADHFVSSPYQCVAVRSSAKGEDGAEFSNAGQYATILNVEGWTAFTKAVSDCLASVHSETATSYAGNLAGETTMTVVVQQMVSAEKSGVCFTADPTGDASVVLVEAVDGFGEALVSGMKAAQQYRIPKGDAVATDDAGVLTTAQLKAVVDGALAAKEAFGIELDTEWSIGADGKLLWLQARPITTADTPDIHELDCPRDLTNHVITSCNIGEMLPGVVTPLTLSTSVNGIDWGMRKMLTTVGVFPSMDKIPPTSCALSIGNKLFLDLTTVYSMGKRIMMADKRTMELAICGRVLEDTPDTDFPEASLPTKVLNGKRYMQFMFSVKKKKQRLDQIAREIEIVPSDDPVEYYDHIDEALPLVNEALYCHYASSAFSGAMSGALFMTMEKDYEDKALLKAKIAGVLENIDDIESVDILRSMRKIAKAVMTEHPDAADYTADQLSAAIHSSEGESKPLYEAFLERHGHRAIREAELRSRAWKDDETALMEYLRVVIASGAEEEETDRDSWLLMQEELLKECKGSTAKAVKFLVGQARKAVQDREYTKSGIIKVIDPFKKAYRELADLLVERKLLVDEDCIFFLTHEEIGRLVKEQETSLVKKALARRRMMPEQEQQCYPEVSVGRPKAMELEVGESGKSFKGVPVSRGLAVGRARVVKSVEDAKQLEKGEIMVAGFTDIGWSPYYCMIEGLVTEVGSALSHGAVVAREYALPLVVNLPNITAIIQTGDYISVDGTTGRVAILDEAEAKAYMARV